MRERYSQGNNARIYRVEANELQRFPQAELVREDRSDDRYWGERLFARHIIASTLFPDHFITVVGAEVIPSEPLTVKLSDGNHHYYPKERSQLLYSKEANIAEGHATFADHMRPGPKGKVSSCPCAQCTEHKQLHEREKLSQLATQTAVPMIDIGITPPVEDPSDYCISPNGIVFFEIEVFEQEKLSAYLKSPKARHDKNTIKLALEALSLHEELYDLSRQDQALRISTGPRRK